MAVFRLNHTLYGLAERRRSRTYEPWGYHGLPVLKLRQNGAQEEGF